MIWSYEMGEQYALLTKGKALHFGTLVKKEDFSLVLKNSFVKTNSTTTFYDTDIVRLKYISQKKKISIDKNLIKSMSKKELIKYVDQDFWW